MEDDETKSSARTDARPPQSPDSTTADSPYTIPGFFAALADGELLGVRCMHCEERLIPPRPACYACGSRDLELERQPETGAVFSYTEVRRPAPRFKDIAPFTVAIVELDSGAKLTARLDATYDETEIGMSVRLEIRESDALADSELDHERDWPLPVFEPV